MNRFSKLFAKTCQEIDLRPQHMHRIRENDDWKAERSLPVSNLFGENMASWNWRYEFTSKIKRMYDDIILSQTQMSEYHQKDDASSGNFFQFLTRNLTRNPLKSGLDVKVLGKSAWPTVMYNKAPNSFTIPKELEISVKSYEKYYE